MLRGCLLALALYAVLAVGYFYWIDRVFEPPGSLIGAGVLALVVFLSIGALMNARNAWRDGSLLAGARMSLGPREGKLFAIAGKIYPIDQPLLAPFSGKESVIVEYDLSRHRRPTGTSDQENTGSDFAGFLMVPAVIRSESREIKLLGYPILEDFGDIPATSYAAARRAIDFLTTREFEDRTGLKMVTVLGVFGDVWSDEDGYVEKNLRLGSVPLTELFPPELEAEIDRQMGLSGEAGSSPLSGDDEELEDEDLNDEDLDDEELEDDEFDDEDDDTADEVATSARPEIPRMTEKRVAVGESVCAIGIYNELRGGLLPPRGSTQPNRLIRGTAEGLEKKSRAALKGNLFGGLFFLVMSHLVTFGIMQIYLHSDELAERRESESSDAVAKGDIARLEGLVRRGMDVNHRDASGAPLLVKSRSVEVTSWLLDHGADPDLADADGMTPLMIAARYGLVDIARRLVAAGADVSRQDSSGDTALDEARRAQNHDIAELIERAADRPASP
ncbi:MAG: ankyrin repeat domain-containing protein [Pirellulaceae bacterium]|jgi:hypothetical protein|nr:ankyrin repeat domain-containing protein [Pirellulaceae bacterium]